MWGLTEDDVTETVEVWPEHQAPLAIFQRVATQWNVGMGGPTGLRYEAVYPLIERATPDLFEDTLDCIQVMEREALRLMNTKDGK
jgi:hypothetical protein